MAVKQVIPIDRIDFRIRPNTTEYLRGIDSPLERDNWQRSGFGPKPDEESLDTFLRKMAMTGITIGVFTGRQLGPPDKPSYGVTNDYVAACVAKSRGALVGIACVDPRETKSATTEFTRALEELGLRGLTLDPQLHGVPPDDRSLYPLYEIAGQHKVPVVTTVGPLGRWTNIQSIDTIASDFPEVTFVCSHGCWPQVTEYLALIYRHHNVYLEPSLYWTLPGTAPIFDAARSFAQDRILYASAFPFGRLEAINDFVSMGFEPDIEYKLTYANAARILGL